MEFGGHLVRPVGLVEGSNGYTARCLFTRRLNQKLMLACTGRPGVAPAPP